MTRNAFIDAKGVVRLELSPIKEIAITRLEGLSEVCDIRRTASSFKEAKAILKLNARSAPKEGGYDKHRFTIIWQNGDEWTGRYDLKHLSKDSCCLATHVRGYIEWYLENDSPLTPEQREEFLRLFHEVELLQIAPIATEYDNYTIIRDERKSTITRDDFIAFYRDEHALNTLSPDDRIEIFCGVLLGSSDFTKELLDEVLSDYGIEHLEIIDNGKGE